MLGTLYPDRQKIGISEPQVSLVSIVGIPNLHRDRLSSRHCSTTTSWHWVITNKTGVVTAFELFEAIAAVCHSIKQNVYLPYGKNDTLCLLIAI